MSKSGSIFYHAYSHGSVNMISPNGGDQMQVRMLPNMAMLKLHAFVQDLGGKVVDGLGPQAGVIHVQFRAGAKSAQPWAISGAGAWSGASPAAKPATPGLDLNMELRVEQSDPKQPDNLTISLALRPTKNSWAASRKEINEQREKILRDLRAYLQATTTSPGDFIPTPY